jgi:hypothetical protein
MIFLDFYRKRCNNLEWYLYFDRNKGYHLDINIVEWLEANQVEYIYIIPRIISEASSYKG